MEALRGVLALDRVPAAEAAGAAACAVTVAAFAGRFGYTPKHVRNLVMRGEIPEAAVIGRGRGQRILVGPALEALRAAGSTAPAVLDELEREGAEYIRRRGRLRVIGAAPTGEAAVDPRDARTTPDGDGRTRRPHHE